MDQPMHIRRSTWPGYDDAIPLHISRRRIEECLFFRCEISLSRIRLRSNSRRQHFSENFDSS